MSRRLGVLLFMLLGILSQLQVANAGDTTFTITPSGDQVSGTHVTLHCKADEGTTRYEIHGTARTADSFNEFGGPDNTGYLYTEEWGVGPITVTCAIRHSNNDWNSAERHSISFNILANGSSQPNQNNNGSGGNSGNNNAGSNQPLILPSEARQDGMGVNLAIYCAGRGFGSPNDPADDTQWTCGSWKVDWSTVCLDVWGTSSFYNFLGNHHKYGIKCGTGTTPTTNTSSTSNSGNSTQNNASNNLAVVRGTGAACGVPNPVYVGAPARITPGGAPNRVRDSAGGSTVIGNIAAGNSVTILEGPSNCIAGYRWWKVTDGRITGWTADGDDKGYWLEIIPGSNTGSGQAEDQSAPSNIIYTYSYGGVSYPVNFNPDDCHIVNGPDIIAKEIEWFSNWASQYPDIITRDINVAKYLNVNSGTIEQLRLNFQQDLISKSANHCNADQLKYEVGGREMDMSGLGNLMYGYYLGGYNENIGAFVANVAQAFNKDTPYQYGDNPDDITQRATGEAIVKAIGFNVTPTPDLVISMANQSKLF